jgi:hypothetical protein
MDQPLAEFTPRGFYDIYRITIRMRDMLCGGKPKNDELLETHLKVKTGFNDQQTARQLADLKEVKPQVSDDDIEEEAKKSSIGFLEDPEKGLFIPTYCVKALMKESASMLGIYMKKLGSKQIFQHGFEIKLPEDLKEKFGVKMVDRLYLGRNKPDGAYEGPVHAKTPKGPVTSIKRVDYVKDIELTFEIWILSTKSGENRHVGEDTLKALLTFAQENGLGADRSQGQGKFDIYAFQCVQKGNNPVEKTVKNPEEGKKGKKGKTEEDEAA